MIEQITFINILQVNPDISRKVRQWRNKDYIRRRMLNRHIISSEEHKQWLLKLQANDSQKFWVVFLNEEPFGSVYLNKVDAKSRKSEWGFYIGEESFLDKGLGRKMMYKFLMLYFDTMKYNELITKVLSGNDKALHLYQQFKFRQVSTEKYNEDEGIIIFKFSAEDWNKYKKELINACN